MIRSKILDMDDLNREDLSQVNLLFNSHFGPNWPEVPCRRWEYCCAILFSDVLSTKGSALDIGCGASIFPVFLKKVAGCDVIAMDPRATDHDVDGIHYRNGSMTNLGVCEQFDIIFAMSSIEHVNAGAYGIYGMDFDTGDTLAMLEMCRALKPGGVLVITTDFADRYYQPPGLWPNGHHRIYDLESLYDRLIVPAIKNYDLHPFGEMDLDKRDDWQDIRGIEPIGYDYTEMILTMKKAA